MRLLIIQIVIKQWDKSQRTDAHILQRANIPDTYAINFPPACYVFDNQCVMDQHGDDTQGNRVKYTQSSDGTIYFDRFRVCLDDNTLAYYNAKSGEPPRLIGSLTNQWVQCKYNCRYSVFESEMFYWLYEEVTVNAIYLSKFNEKVFLNAEPLIVYRDINELDITKTLK